MDRLQERLENYYGYLTEIRAGLKAEPVEKPVELGVVETMDLMGLPLVAGGVMDQPHIWLLQYQLVRSVRQLFEATWQRNAAATKQA